MVYEWEVIVNGEKQIVQAVNSYTAIHRCVDKKIHSGTILFKRLRNIRRIECADCGQSYQDNPESKKHHFEVYFFHKEAVKKKRDD